MKSNQTPEVIRPKTGEKPQRECWVSHMKRTLEELEGVVWGPPEFQSGLVLRCHAARKKPIDTLTDVELATLLNQEIGIKWILPESIERLARDMPDDTELYDGQLSEAVEKAKKTQPAVGPYSPEDGRKGHR